MKTEQIIDQLANILSEFTYDVKKNSELDILNKANEVLYPLKENNDIFNYYFSGKQHEGSFILTVFIQENENSQTDSWELTIQKNN